MPFFSIVVPVYNVESYLPECIESILTQSFRDYELILVNDGSTDHSGVICDKVALTDSRIQVIHKKNGGLSDARNAGIGKAKGDYTIFVDSDDYIELGALEKFYNELKESDNPDVMITRIKQVYADLETKYMDKSMPVELLRNGNKNDVVKWVFSKSNNTWPAPRYIVKRSLITKHNLKFKYGYLHEDLDWTSRLFLYAITFTCSEFYWYNHRMNRHDSITTNKSPKRTSDVIKLVAKNIKDSEYNYISINVRNIMFERLLKSLFASLSDYKFYDYEGKRAIIELLNQNRYVFKYTTKFRHRVFVIFCIWFGFKIGLSLMNVFHKV